MGNFTKIALCMLIYSAILVYTNADCDLCARTGQCSEAFKGQPGQFCGLMNYNGGRSCCCPVNAQCNLSPYSCRCRSLTRQHEVYKDMPPSSGTSFGGVLVFIAALIGLCCCCCCKGNKKHDYESEKNYIPVQTVQQPQFVQQPQYGNNTYQQQPQYVGNYQQQSQYTPSYQQQASAPYSTGPPVPVVYNNYGTGGANVAMGAAAGLATGVVLGSALGSHNDTTVYSSNTYEFDGDSGGNQTFDFAGDSGTDFGGDTGNDFSGDF